MEDAYIIRGGKPLSGEIRLSGAKNVSIKVIIATLLINDEVILENVPRINDVFELLHLINMMGGKAKFIDINKVVIDGRSINTNKVDFLHGSKIRVSFMLLAPLLFKFKKCLVPNPGGCRIGARPIDRVVEAMKELGLKVEYHTETGYYNAQVARQTTDYYCFKKSSHTATELLILISSVGKSIFENSKDKIVIDNAALEPEIDELIKFLNKSGAQIKREQKKIIIHPVKKLNNIRSFSIISDRNEAVTYASLAVATKGGVIVSGTGGIQLDSFIKKLKQAGAGVDFLPDNRISFYYKQTLNAVNIETHPHPGFMTDWQPNWAVLMTQAKGQSIIQERVFENRFSYVAELRKLGANIDYIKMPVSDPFEYFFFNFDPHKKYNQAIKIIGPQMLHGAVLSINDLRAGATLAIAALVADGESVVNGVSILERGYENFVDKVKSLGGEIEKV